MNTKALNFNAGAKDLGSWPPGKRARDYALIIPLLAVLLIVTLTGMLIWTTLRDTRSEERDKLTTDALWVEQYLRFQLQTFETEVRDLSTEIGRAPDNRVLLETTARHLVSIHPEIVDITWWRKKDDLAVSFPPETHQANDYRSDLELQAQRSGRPLFSPPRKTQSDGWVTDIVAPVFIGNKPVGSVWTILSLEKIIERNVPWWVAGKYQVSLSNSGGDILVSRSGQGPLDPNAQHTISFDPPLTDLFIMVTRYHSQAAIGPLALSLAIIGLAVLVVVNLWIAYRHSRRRAAAEHALRLEHSFRKAMESSLTIGMRARDRESRIIYVNPEFCRMVGYEASELIGLMPPHPYWAPEIVEEGIQRQIDLRNSEPRPREFESRFIRPDGKLLEVMVYEAPLIDANDQHIGWMGSIVDVTDRKRLEETRQIEAERLQHNARLITMGEMASTLAHELNQPLAAITSYSTGSLNLLENAPHRDEDLVAALRKLAQQAQRAGAIVHRVHDFVRKRKTSFEPHDLVALVDEAISFVGAETRKRGGQIELTSLRKPVSIIADGVLVQQAVINLIRNAQEAVSGLDIERRSIRICVEVFGNEARIRVSDRGVGVAEDLRANIFTPFVTSKTDGMGMGLPICRSILEAHKGHLWLEAAEPALSGTTFVMSLPLGAMNGDKKTCQQEGLDE